jgi:Icc-related predicted phosphoesterase
VILLPTVILGPDLKMIGRLTVRGRKFVVVGQNGENLVLPCRLLESTVRVPHRGNSLRLLAFSDYRVQDIHSLIRFIKVQQRPDLILYAGDDIRRFREGTKNLFQQLAALAKYGLCAVAGNDDKPEVRTLIGGHRVYPVHSRALVLGQFAILGIEGAPMFPRKEGFDKSYNMGCLLYPEPILRWHMKSWTTARFRGKKLIIVSHTPPYGVLDFAMRFGRRNIGSRPLREFLETNSSALVCISGHVHSQGARSEQLGDTLVINASSHDGPGDPGRVAVIQVVDGAVSPVDWHEIN